MSRRASRHVLATVVFTDIVDSSRLAHELGDRRWRVLLDRHHAIVRKALKRYRGKEIDNAGDGFFATFPDQADAIRCACAVSDEVKALGIEVRAGCHVGHAEVIGRKLGGVTIHAGARVMAEAAPGEVLVSSMVRDLLPASGFEFADRGVRRLKGIDGEWRLYAVTSVDGAPRSAPLDATTAKERLALIEPPPFAKRHRGLLVGGGAAALLIGVAVGVAVVATRPEPVHHRPLAPLDSVVRIDSATGTLVQQGATDLPLEQSYDVEMAVGEGAVWLLAGSGGVDLFQLDEASGEVRNSIPEVVGFGIGRGVVWIDNSGVVGGPGVHRPILAAVDPSTGSQLMRSGAGYLLSASPGAVWVTVQGGVAEVDPKTGRAAKMFGLSGHATDGAAMPGAYWVADNTADTLTRIDLRSGVKTTVPLAATPDRIVIGGGYVWALDRAGGTVTVMDASTAQLVASMRVSAHPTDLAYGSGALWVSDGVDGTITRIDAATRQLSSLHEGVPIRAVAVDQSTGDLWIAVAPGRHSTPL